MLAATPLLLAGLAGTAVPAVAHSPEPAPAGAAPQAGVKGGPEDDVLTLIGAEGESGTGPRTLSSQVSAGNNASAIKTDSPADCQAWIESPTLVTRPTRVRVTAGSDCDYRVRLRVAVVVESEEVNGWRVRGSGNKVEKTANIRVTAHSSRCWDEKKRWRGRSYHESTEGGSTYVARLKTPARSLECVVN
ncbi:hypothetical protein SAMN05421505_12346 [Sinosporangium album]|uniref:Ig-like domain-containing protein n=1 Tax=Sinosporangium album TaxID=504805 RepID=A0A1G8FEV9_9ACTN|nr:hypothetical protein [Sinosporangium album]SDH80549.1 hypothetical protein SAMN05421505_12346 [Sinosporangium album]